MGSINGSTQIVGLIGWPVSHSFSPLLQNTAFEACEINFAYIPLPVAPGCLAQAVEGLKGLQFAGANVTIPHKVDIIPLLDEIDPAAKKIGAVNTIVVRDGQLYGYNTDAPGFMSSLAQNQVVIEGKKAMMLGAGGAARAVICGLLDGQSEEIFLAARNMEQAKALAVRYAGEGKLTPIELGCEEFERKSAECALIVNCTPLGMQPWLEQMPPLDFAVLARDTVIYDLIYNPTHTMLLIKAAECGFKTIGGMEMLIEQGALAFEKWTSVTAPRDVMYKTMSKICC